MDLSLPLESVPAADVNAGSAAVLALDTFNAEHIDSNRVLHPATGNVNTTASGNMVEPALLLLVPLEC
jgi:hypothetical protein